MLSAWVVGKERERESKAVEILPLMHSSRIVFIFHWPWREPNESYDFLNDAHPIIRSIFRCHRSNFALSQCKMNSLQEKVTAHLLDTFICCCKLQYMLAILPKIKNKILMSSLKTKNLQLNTINFQILISYCINVEWSDNIANCEKIESNRKCIDFLPCLPYHTGGLINNHFNLFANRWHHYDCWWRWYVSDRKRCQSIQVS